MKSRGEKTQVANTGSKSQAAAAHAPSAAKARREDYTLFYANILDYLDDTFLVSHEIPKLIRKETESFNSPLTIKKNWVYCWTPSNKDKTPSGFPGKFYERFKDLITPYTHTIAYNRRGGSMPPTLFFKGKHDLQIKITYRHCRKTPPNIIHDIRTPKALRNTLYETQQREIRRTHHG